MVTERSPAGMKQTTKNSDPIFLDEGFEWVASQEQADKLIAQGVPEDMIKLATEKSQEISAAYDLIDKTRAGD